MYDLAFFGVCYGVLHRRLEGEYSHFLIALTHISVYLLPSQKYLDLDIYSSLCKTFFCPWSLHKISGGNSLINFLFTAFMLSLGGWGAGGLLLPATVNQHPPVHHQGWMICDLETFFCWVPVP